MNYNEYDEAIIESALDIYDEYDVSMEEAIDMAMEGMEIRKSPNDRRVRPVGGNEIFAATHANKYANPPRRRKPVTLGNALGGAAVAAGVTGAGIALSKYRKKKLAQAAKLQREAEAAEAKAANARAQAEQLVADAK
jgi:hypothetical protein